MDVLKILQGFACDDVKIFFILYENMLILCGVIRAILITLV